MTGGRTTEQLGSSVSTDPCELLGDLVTPPGPLNLEPFDYAFGSPATGGLYRLRGPGWSWFCKILQHVRHWPGLAELPPEYTVAFASEFPWRSELELWDEPFLSRLPEGMRAPQLHGIVDLGDDRLAVWTEDVDLAPPSWGLEQFGRAAYLLGQWNARCADPELVATNEFPIGLGLRMYAERSVPMRGLAPLENDNLWTHPWLVDHAALRQDLRRLGADIPAMLDRLDGCVQTIPHGDASPQNLLVPVEDPTSFVVIDVSFRTPHALGFDLGQLLVGLTHAGQLPAAQLPRIADRILTAYVEGLIAEGVSDQAEAVQDAFTTSVLLRSGFDSFLYDLIGNESEDERHAFSERVALCRFLVDQYLAVHPAS